MKRSIALVAVFLLLFIQLDNFALAKDGKNDEVTINPLAVYEDPENPFGKAHKAKVKVLPNKSGKLRVGFFEEEVAGTGTQWRAAGWMAAITGTFLLGKNLSDYKFTFDVTGRIDGPSAGGLMTVGVLASILGDDIKKNTTMTGTINPDGTIGPVGGIIQKIEGAKKAKKKLVLIPTGQRHSLDLKTGETIDAIDFGQEKGVKVAEVSDIYAAYKKLTGKSLPKPKVSSASPDLSSRMYDKLKGKANEWYSEFTKIKSNYAAIDPAYKSPELDELMATAEAFAQSSNKYLDEGLIAPSYNEAILAAVYADLAYQGAKIIESFVVGGMAGTKNYLESAKSSELRTEALLDRLKSEKPRSLSDVIALANAFGSFSSAIGLEVMGDDNANLPAANEEEEITNLAQAITLYSVAGHVLTEADDTLDMGMGEGRRQKPDSENVKQLSEALRRAAEANLEYFDTVVLAELASARGVSLDVMRQAFANEEFDYAFAVSAVNVLPELKKKFKKGQMRDYATLGNSLQSFMLSSGLLAKYYAVGIETDESGNVIGVENEKALISMLDIANKTAVQNINLAKKTKGKTDLPTAHYEAARILREGDSSAKLEALSEFWEATMESRIMAMLSGKKLINVD